MYTLVLFKFYGTSTCIFTLTFFFMDTFLSPSRLLLVSPTITHQHTSFIFLCFCTIVRLSTSLFYFMIYTSIRAYPPYSIGFEVLLFDSESKLLAFILMRILGKLFNAARIFSFFARSYYITFFSMKVMISLYSLEP